MRASFYAFLIYKVIRYMRRMKLRVPKYEIIDRSDFHAFYTIKSLWGGGGATIGLKLIFFLIFRDSFRATKFLTRMLSLILRRIFLLSLKY